MSRVSHKYRQESMKVGNIRTIFTWNKPDQKKANVSYIIEDQVIPEEGSLCSLLSDSEVQPEERNELISPPTERRTLLIP